MSDARQANGHADDHDDGLLVRVRGLVTKIGGRTIHDGIDLDLRRG